MVVESMREEKVTDDAACLCSPSQSASGFLPCFLADKSSDVVARGKVLWMSGELAYVLMPYGTAITYRQHWEATLIVPGDHELDHPQERHLSVQLIAANRCIAAAEEMEGLLLRLLDTEGLTASLEAPAR